jgi:hypothetical protein
MDEPLEVVRQIHRNLREWLEVVRKFPDPGAQPPGTLEQISLQLKLVDQAVRRYAGRSRRMHERESALSTRGLIWPSTLADSVSARLLRL